MTSSVPKKSRRFVSKVGLDIVKKPDQFFNSYSFFTGTINYKGTLYNLKKIDLKGNVCLDDLPEVQIVNSEYKNEYLLDCIDYIIEQEENDGIWENIALYILLENSDYDLRTYLLKYGSLNLDNMLKLIECLIAGNYYLQSEMKLAHRDIRPQNIRIIMKEDPTTKTKEPVFKLSYFDDVLKVVNNQTPNSVDTLSYMAPELLCSFAVSLMQQNLAYLPSHELQALITECPDELRYDPSRADVFSAGLVLLSAATGIIFSLNQQTQNFEFHRDGSKEICVINQNLKSLKNKYQCQGLTEIMRIMLTHNPLLRCDFEELAIRLNKMNSRNPALPLIELAKDDSPYELLRQNYWELQEMIQEKEGAYRDVIEKLEKEIQRLSEENKQNFNQFKGLDTIVNTLNELSSIMSVDEENYSFISTISQKKTIDALSRNDKKDHFLAADGLSTGEFSKSMTKECFVHRQAIVGKDMPPVVRKDLEDKATFKDLKAKKMSLGHLRHQESKNSIIRRRETLNVHDM